MRRSYFAVIALLTSLLASCSGANRTLGHSEYVFDFNNLSGMVASSDLVIEGTVVQVADGRSIKEDDAVLRFENVTISVDRVFSGKPDASVAKVVVAELPTQELPLTPADSHGFFFLIWDKINEVYAIIAPEGRFLKGANGLTSTTAPEFEDSWVKPLEGLDHAAVPRRTREGGHSTRQLTSFGHEIDRLTGREMAMALGQSSPGPRRGRRSYGRLLPKLPAAPG